MSPYFKDAVIAVVLAAIDAAAAGPLTLTEYLALGGPEPRERIRYGSAPSQYIELFEPAGVGPFPVVVLIHGGCWKAKFGGIEQMRGIAGALAAQGIAVWSVEYRRVDEEGGGYPGTYQDINAALQRLAADAPTYKLDTHRMVAMGHSAGGQLAQWLAGRDRIPPSSPLYQANALPVHQIISLGGLADLHHQRDRIERECNVRIFQLTGWASASRRDIYVDTNPAELMPNGSHTVLINGELDSISPPSVALDYARRARLAGDSVQTIVLRGAGHYEEAAAISPSWQLILPVVQDALRIDTAN